MNTIIEKIRAEIERLKKEGENGDALAQANNDYESHLQWEQQIAVANMLLSKLSFLSNLEKECEKPTNIDFEQELYKHFGQVKDFTLGMQIGKYFYELGCRDTVECYKERSEELVCEGLDGEITEFIANHYEVDYYDGLKHLGEYLDTYDVEEIARHFAQWQEEQDDKELSEKIAAAYQLGLADKEEQMMKEAVEGKIAVRSFRDQILSLHISYRDMDKTTLSSLHTGGKVRIIICKKED